MKKTFIALLLLIGFATIYANSVYPIISPDKNLKLEFKFSDAGNLTFSLSANKKMLINHSKLGLVAENKQIPALGWSIEKIEYETKDTIWKPVWGKRVVVAEKYKQLKIYFNGNGQDKISHMQIIARVYNEGVAFRYIVPCAKNTTFSGELTRFDFSADFSAWFYNGENHNIGPEKLTETDGSRRPVMTIRAAKNQYLAIHEADLVTGSPLLLNSKKGETSFSVSFSPLKCDSIFTSAWRVILYGKTPGELVDQHTIELLNPAPKDDFSWVKPGVALWDWRINGAITDDFTYRMDYPSWVRMIDFAAENKFAYLVLDANWYGPEHEADSNPLIGDKARDVQKIIGYGKLKGVGVWLYLNDVGGRKYPIEETLKQYSDWGAAGVKYGFMRGRPQDNHLWTVKITELCAQNRLLCNFHDGPVHPYGQMRTFPNAVTREYCQAQLDAHKVFMPKTFVTSVFVNMVAGPIDMNNGMFDLRQGNTTRIDENQPVPSTVVSEAARTLIVFSGVTIIPDVPEYYRKYPELLQFIAAQKMPWKESKTLSGEIGEYIVMARQASDDTWLVGAATNESAREINISLDFLKSGKYEVLVIEDGDDANYLTNREVFKTRKVVQKSHSNIKVKLAAGGGACLIIRKKI